MSEPVRLRIERLGHRGDGETSDGIYVPLTVPGDLVLGEIDDGRALIHRIIEAGPNRVEPPCRHFGHCGGCALQHVKPEFLAEWKREQITTALAQRGLKDVTIAPTVTMPPRSRRRAELHARLTNEGVKIGFLERGTRIIVDMTECQILSPELFALLPALRKALAPVLPPHKHVAVHMLSTSTGVDMALGIPDFELGLNERRSLIAMADQLSLSRLTVNRDSLAQFREPLVLIAGVPVILPPEGFLQAASEAEVLMQSMVTSAMASAKTVADIFAGCGTFALALARTAKVTAFESDAEALSALQAAVRRAQGLKPIRTERRDLFRRPLLPQELNAFDAVVIDPPRPGAKTQCEALAQSKVKTIVSISCNPATFARDAEVLAKGGYEILSVTPIDQFLWTPHIELVAVLARR